MQPLKPGQIWQCRDQQASAKITRIDIEDSRIWFVYRPGLLPPSWEAGQDVNRPLMVANDSYKSSYATDRRFDFVVLLYDPASE